MLGRIGLERMIDGRQAHASQHGNLRGDNCLPETASQHFGQAKGDMPRLYDSLTLEDAKRMLSAAEEKAASLGIAYNIAIVDAGGHLVAFVRQDGALIGSIDLAIDKAVTARIFDKATSDLASLAQSGKPLFGIQESNAGKVVIFGGGIPVTFDGSIVGAVGASAGTVEQDIAVAEAAIAALGQTQERLMSN
jgi:uncharacterized protein GlcG (DUF336 family)